MPDLTAAQLADLRGIASNLTDQELRLLFQLAARVADGCIVEVGSFRGRSTAALALGALAGHRAPVYAIEPHEAFTGVLGGVFGPEDRGSFFAAMLRLRLYPVVRLVNLSSEYLAAGWPLPVRLLWIDGDHSEAGVRRDLACWLPKLHPDATIAFHDAVNPALGPARAIPRLLADPAWRAGPAVDLIRTLARGAG
jgi:hypothetical protein